MQYAVPGPGYYYSERADVDHRMTLSTSKRGSASFASETKRFPLRHQFWGMPGPTDYDPQMEPRVRAPERPSASFIAVGRDHSTRAIQMTDTPAPGQYNVADHESIEARQLERTLRTAQPTSSEYVKLKSAANKEHKSVSQFIIESDPNYMPLPDPIQETLTTAAERFCPENVKHHLQTRAATKKSPYMQARTEVCAVMKDYSITQPTAAERIGGIKKARTADTLGSTPRIARGFQGKVLTGRIAGSSTTFTKKPITAAGPKASMLESAGNGSTGNEGMSLSRQKRFAIYERLVHDAPEDLKQQANLPVKGQYKPSFGLATANADTILREYRLQRRHEELLEEEAKRTGPGVYNVEEQPLSTKGTPSLSLASERFQEKCVDEMPGPGTYDLSRELGTKKSFILNENQRFLTV